MALRAAYDAFEQSLAGVGINENGIVKTITDESRIVETLTNFDADEYRLMSSNFKYDQSLGYIWKEKKRQSMKLEFQRIMNVTMLWMTTPIERDARLLRSALKMGDAAGVSVLIEIVCTRPFADFLAIKYLYGKLFKSDLLFDLDQHVPGKAVRCLINLFSIERRQDIIKGEEKCLRKDITTLQNATSGEPQTRICIKHIVSILTQRSIGHLRNMYRFCQPEMRRQPKSSLWISTTFLCLVDPIEYFYQVLSNSIDSSPSLVTDIDDHQNEDCIEDDHQDEASLHCLDSISRIIMTRRGVDLDEINTKFRMFDELSLQDRIKLYCKGTYQKLLLELLLNVNILGSEAESSAPSGRDQEEEHAVAEEEEHAVGEEEEHAAEF
ncbi:annexin D4 isoform X2 [Cucumis sativus]|nr:annexin D4 isoform X2 [Cucumis sativus]XP_011655916.1 annexin D4 isoform X2 [Cucumis sativus]XP_031740849.1 annexin D4 isoform X2 [Cucumis sativus]XP_031740850.1 annexin D4 isoform X2 [Cucumis sativus]KAE8648865.1 hypothetical protein Csa_009155 [Cucumis sativus]